MGHKKDPFVAHQQHFWEVGHFKACFRLLPTLLGHQLVGGNDGADHEVAGQQENPDKQERKTVPEAIRGPQHDAPKDAERNQGEEKIWFFGQYFWRR